MRFPERIFQPFQKRRTWACMLSAPRYCHLMQSQPPHNRFSFAPYVPETVRDACCEQCGGEVKTIHPHSLVVRCVSCGQEQFILRAIEAQQAKAVSA